MKSQSRFSSYAAFFILSVPKYAPCGVRCGGFDPLASSGAFACETDFVKAFGASLVHPFDRLVVVMLSASASRAEKVTVVLRKVCALGNDLSLS